MNMRFAAHRGVHDADKGVKENTLAAFKVAVAEHADLIELDIRLTKDRRVVVNHDPDLERVWGDARRVEDVTLAELQEANQNPDNRVPLLSEVLTLIHNSGSLLLIDMDNARVAEPAYQVVHDMGMEKEVEWCGLPEGMQVIRDLSP